MYCHSGLFLVVNRCIAACDIQHPPLNLIIILLKLCLNNDHFFDLSLKSLTHHGVLSPVSQAVIHRDLLPFGDVSYGDDHKPDLRAAVNLSNATVWRRMEKHGAPDATRSLFSQLRDAG